jgi:hypothetical protein
VLPARRRGRRVIRRFLLGSGPLERSSDRVQMLFRVLFLVIALAAGPVAGAVSAVSEGQLSAIVVQQAHAPHHTRTVLLQDAVAGDDRAPGAAATAQQVVSAIATWPTPRGAFRIAPVPALVGTRAGTSLTVWTTADGRPTTPPLDRSAVDGRAVTNGVATFLGILLTAGAGYGLLYRLLARRRDRQRTQGWAAVGPVWRVRLR